LDNLTSSELQRIERDAEVLGRHANQAKLLDPTNASLSVARHLRAIWEIIYYRASGGEELPPVVFDNESLRNTDDDSLGSLVLKDGVTGFGQQCTDPESEEESEAEEDDELVSVEEGGMGINETGGEGSAQITVGDGGGETPHLSDDEDPNGAPKWTFTSESVEDYLKRREMEKRNQETTGEPLPSSDGLGSLPSCPLSSTSSTLKPSVLPSRRLSLPQIKERLRDYLHDGDTSSDEEDGRDPDSMNDGSETDDPIVREAKRKQREEEDENNCPDLPVRTLSAVIAMNTKKMSTTPEQNFFYSRRSPSILQKGYLHQQNLRTGADFRTSSGHILPPPLVQPSPKSGKKKGTMRVGSPTSSSSKQQHSFPESFVEEEEKEEEETEIIGGESHSDVRPSSRSPQPPDRGGTVEHHSTISSNSFFERSQDTTQQVLLEQDMTLHPLVPLTQLTTMTTDPTTGAPLKPYLNIWNPEELGPSSFHLLVVLPYDNVERSTKEIVIPPLLNLKPKLNKGGSVDPPGPVLNLPLLHPPHPTSLNQNESIDRIDRRSPSPRLPSPPPSPPSVPFASQYPRLPVYDLYSSTFSFPPHRSTAGDDDDSFSPSEIYQDKMLTPHLPTHESTTTSCVHDQLTQPQPPQRDREGYLTSKTLSIELGMSSSTDPSPSSMAGIHGGDLYTDHSRSISLGTKERDYDLFEDTPKHIHQLLDQQGDEEGNQLLVEGVRTQIGAMKSSTLKGDTGVGTGPGPTPMIKPTGYVYRLRSKGNKSTQGNKAKKFVSFPLNSKG
jgi:hypothetical protein